jgi:hypothetical protein
MYVGRRWAMGLYPYIYILLLFYSNMVGMVGIYRKAHDPRYFFPHPPHFAMVGTTHHMVGTKQTHTLDPDLYNFWGSNPAPSTTQHPPSGEKKVLDFHSREIIIEGVE